MTTKLEEEFREAVDHIKSKVKIAAEAMIEADALSAKYGIPMTVGIGLVSDVHLSETDEPSDRWLGLDESLIYELTGQKWYGSDWYDSGCTL